MKTGIAVICRYNSQRLPGKILREISHQPLISHIIGRLQKGSPNTPIVVATSDESTDAPIIDYCRRRGIETFKGSLQDPADRLLKTALHKNWEYIARINGDNLFVDPSTLQSMLAIANTGEFDFITNVPGRTFPYGMSIEIIRTKFYEQAIQKFSQQSHHEHITSWLYENPQAGKYYTFKNSTYPEASALNLAIDTEEDLERAANLIEKSKRPAIDIDLKEICRVNTSKNENSPWKGEAGPLLIAEIGGNHEGDYKKAKKLTDLAIASTADCIKFQLYTGDSLVNPKESPDRNKHFTKFELTKEQHIALAKSCEDAGKVYAASVWDLEMLDWIDPYLNFYKIGSGDLTCWPLISEMAIRGKPILLSTGLATLDDVIQTVEFIRKTNPLYKTPAMLCVMQCTSMYPIPDSDANLRVMDTLAATLDTSIGYSDHTIGSDALLAAAAMGAEALEFHFTDSREGKEFRDHKVSLTAEETKVLKENIRKINTLKGSPLKSPQQSELDNNHHTSFRRAVYPNKKINRGTIIRKQDLKTLRPANGTDARDTRFVIGSRALRDLAPNDRLVLDVDYSLND